MLNGSDVEVKSGELRDEGSLVQHGEHEGLEARKKKTLEEFEDVP